MVVALAERTGCEEVWLDVVQNGGGPHDERVQQFVWVRESGSGSAGQHEGRQVRWERVGAACETVGKDVSGDA